MTSTNKPPVRTPLRERVFEIIDGERNYQDENDPPTELELTHGEALMALELQLEHAKGNWSNQPEGRQATINNIRKIAGIAVRALETLGAIPREFHVPASAGIVGTLQGTDKNDKL